MKLFRLFMLLIAISICAASAFAQAPVCTQTEAPELNGFRLGMTIAELTEMLEDASVLDAKLSSGASKIKTQVVNITGAELKEKHAEGVDNVNLSFVDGKLFVIKVTYHGGTIWSSQEEFIAKVSEKLGLPKPSNAARGRGNEKYKIECRKFAAMLAYSFGVSPNVTVYDKAAQQMVDERGFQNPDGEVRDIRIGPVIPPPPRP